MEITHEDIREDAERPGAEHWGRGIRAKGIHSG